MNRRSTIIGASVGLVTVAAVGVAIIAGGSDSVIFAGMHRNTTLDASSDSSPPGDWGSSYSRTGSICYSQDATATTSACYAANALPVTTDATDTGWPIEKQQINRFPTNQGGACGGAPWVCSTATMDSTSTDPAGGTTASTVTFGGGTIDATAFGYSASTALDLRFWAKCAGGGTLDATHVGGTGHWTVDATAMGSGWRLLYPARAEVTEAAAFTSDASGFLHMRISGVDCSFWGFTATEQSSWHHSTIPTVDATGSTVGAPVWTVDDSAGSYYAASGCNKVESITTYDGTCWDYTAPTITLTGASTCTATWYALSLTWED